MALGINFDFKTFHFTSGGESAQWWGPMATAVIFGMTYATVLTLVFVPTLYTYVVDLAQLFSRKPAAMQVTDPIAK
jgi:Cu/Ag efflux pump CusA